MLRGCDGPVTPARPASNTMIAQPLAANYVVDGIRSECVWGYAIVNRGREDGAVLGNPLTPATQCPTKWEFWQGRRGSNPRPSVLETDALAN